jgi:diacylglycerol kinase (ATP)
MAKPDKRGLPRLIDAFGYSMKGFTAAWRYEESFRQELILVVLLLPFAFWLASTPVELILLISSLFGVLIAELINSAIEAVVDRTGLELHELSGRAKDIGSAMVFLSILLAGLIWGIIGWSRLMF